jgi:Family of unknown function (DUF5684)
LNPRNRNPSGDILRETLARLMIDSASSSLMNRGETGQPTTMSPLGGDMAQELSVVAAVFAGPFFLFILVVIVFYIAAYWKVFTKAGEPGWGALVPIYNLYLMCKIAGRPEWWLILFFIPLVNVAIALIVSMDMAKAFGKTAGFGIGLWLLSFIFIPILGFGSAQYTKPSPVVRY